MKGETALMELSFANAKEALEFEVKSREEKLKLLKQQPGIIGNEAATRQAEEISMKSILPFQRALEMLPAAQQVAQVSIAKKYGVSGAIAASQTGKIAGTEAKRGEVSTVKTAAEVGSAEYNSMIAQSKQTLAEITVQEELKAVAARNTYDIQKSSIDSAKEQLSLAEVTGALTKQDIAEKTRVLTIQQAEADRLQKLQEIEKERFLASIEYSNKVLEAGGEETDQLKEQYNLIVAKSTFGTAAAEREYQARLKTADITASLASKQTQYETVFKNSFEGMADAIVEFAKTGKLSFKDLTNTMLTELLRIELRMQMADIWKALRPGVGSIFSSIFPSAQGSVYDGGLQKFAKGGMFTNSIVDSPTLFKFAKGTGLMGEAGPEAIMPLKRDSQGNLGVSAGGGGSNVDVVVINNTGEKAETRETTDSRGNRKVEVMIGDMTAGEISRSGSASQKSIRSTFGIQPQLIRR
jgi:lambda family phage tail tape measure protein